MVSGSFTLDEFLMHREGAGAAAATTSGADDAGVGAAIATPAISNSETTISNRARSFIQISFQK